MGLGFHGFGFYGFGFYGLGLGFRVFGFRVYRVLGFKVLGLELGVFRLRGGERRWGAIPGGGARMHSAQPFMRTSPLHGMVVACCGVMWCLWAVFEGVFVGRHRPASVIWYFGFFGCVRVAILATVVALSTLKARPHISQH